MIKNLTPHPVNIRVGDKEIIIPPEGIIPRVEILETPAEGVDGIPCVSRRLGKVIDLPEPQPGVFLLVSSLVFENSQRADLLCPDTGPTCIRNGNGQIVAVTRLVRKGCEK